MEGKHPYKTSLCILVGRDGYRTSTVQCSCERTLKQYRYQPIETSVQLTMTSVPEVILLLLFSRLICGSEQNNLFSAPAPIVPPILVPAPAIPVYCHLKIYTIGTRRVA